MSTIEWRKLFILVAVGCLVGSGFGVGLEKRSECENWSLNGEVFEKFVVRTAAVMLSYMYLER